MFGSDSGQENKDKDEGEENMKFKEVKKLLALGLVAAMVAGAAGCGTNAVNSSAAAGSAEAENTAEADTSAAAEAEAAKTEIVIAADADTTSTVNGLDEELCSWTDGGTDASTIDGDDYAFTPVVYVKDGVYDAEKSLAGETAAVTDTETSNLDLTIEKESVNGIIVKDSDYTIADSVINVETPAADGSTTCDFSGLGSAVAIYGDSAVEIKDSEINADGVANLAVFADDGSSALLENVKLHSDGGTLYENYVNSPAQSTMVAPPWILGIMGNSRGTNLMGDDSTMTVVDSDVSASNWAVLSTDSGSNMYLNVANTTMSLTGTDDPMQADGAFDTENPYTKIQGYGTYAIGAAVEKFLGTTMNVGTYATIFTGGTGYYGNLTAGESYDLPAADGSTHYTYTADEDVQTVINSDTFGFMAHQGTNDVTIDGAVVNSEYTDFLIKSGNDTTITVENGAQINAGNGILLQLLDNDDSTTEFDGANMAFGKTHEENAGFPTEAVNVDSDDAEDSELRDVLVGGGQESDLEGTEEAAPEGETAEGEGAPEGEGGGMPAQPTGPNQSVYNVVDTDLTGAIYNGIGWKANDLSDGNVRQMFLDVNLSGTATLKGAIASTSCIHATYEGQNYLKENGITAFDNDEEAAAFAAEYQNTSFSQAEYFDIGQVANLVKSNGLNDINVTLSDSAVWTVSDTSLIKSLSIADDAQVVVEDGVTLTVDGTAYEAGTYTAADFE